MNIKRLLKHLFTSPWSPRGRGMRIEKLMRGTGEERDICAAIVYYRDASRNLLTGEELKDFYRIGDRLVRGEIILPVDKKL